MLSGFKRSEKHELVASTYGSVLKLLMEDYHMAESEAIKLMKESLEQFIIKVLN